MFIPTDLQYFVDFEVKDRKKRVSAVREVPTNVMYRDHLVEQGIIPNEAASGLYRPIFLKNYLLGGLISPEQIGRLTMKLPLALLLASGTLQVASQQVPGLHKVLDYPSRAITLDDIVPSSWRNPTTGETDLKCCPRGTVYHPARHLSRAGNLPGWNVRPYQWTAKVWTLQNSPGVLRFHHGTAHPCIVPPEYQGRARLLCELPMEWQVRALFLQSCKSGARDPTGGTYLARI
ncbi:hypothetical protein Asppvi_008995 [Aspergillus pseudoviridinutans]|uniref:Uncharacterized protein n=1 Tax=Aspergillus pseudoviridinutans TaxID=1517512 RepID=A0A9P3BEY1_9EURO|nr:uncharacterized protein Asppvi_008995 [Aspergillus pseudoviridinutans]GIJ90046.1 hypothetical protein Asppvi_008995 [Aspergillus pseudoviridinutans]